MLNIHHKMPIYQDCTLGELIVIALASLLGLTLIFSLLTKIILGYVWPGYILASILFFPVIKLLIAQLQKLKYGKPYGYYQQLLTKKLAEYGILHCRYVTRLGRWSVRRMK